MKKQLVALLLLLTGNIYAQRFDINGFVEGGGEFLVSSTVVVLSEKDSTIIGFTLSNNEGRFQLKNIKPDNYLLQITYLGFEQYSNPIVLTGQNLDLGTINLIVNSALLDQVEIKGEHVPLMVKKDTLVYNAAAFQTQPNEVVEDLLRKLPGVEVEADGTIKAQGEDVQSVLVDGKVFFGNDQKIATRNLPADAVNKIQIFDQQSDMAEFSGVDDGQRIKTINLQLKEGHKNGHFGTATAGYGTDNRYSGKLSLNRFNTETKLSVIGNFNNINEQGFSVQDYSNFVGGSGGFRRSGDSPIFNGLSNGFVTTNAGGLNVNHDFSEKTELSFSYFLNVIENDINGATSRESFLEGNTSYFTNTNTSQQSDGDNHKFNLEFSHKIDSTQDIKIVTGLVYNNGLLASSSNTSILNQQDFLENYTDGTYGTDNDKLEMNGNITYRKKFGSVKKRVFTLNGSYNNAEDEILANILSDNIIYNMDNSLPILSFLNQQVDQSDYQKDYSIEASFVEPLRFGKFLEFKYRRQNFNNDVLTEYFDEVGGNQVFNSDLSNAFIRDYVFDRYGAAMHFTSEKSQLTLEGTIQNSHLTGDLIFDEILIKKDVTRFLPRINWRYALGQGSSLRLNYNTNIDVPSLTQLQPIPDNSNPLDIYQGNPDLKPSYNHRMRLNYFKYDQFSFQSFYAFFNINYTKNDIIDETLVDNNFIQFTQPINVDYNLNVTGSQEFGSPIKFLNLRMSIRNRLGYTKGFVFVNRIENTSNQYNGNVRLKLENRVKEKLDWNIGGSYGYNTTEYSESTAQNQSFTSQNLFAELTYNYKNSVAFNTGLNVDFYSEEQFGEQRTVPIWKASISKYFLENQKGELKLIAFDLLNKNIGVSRSTRQNYIENSEVISLGRYVMLSFTYALRGRSSGGNQGGGRGGFRG